MSVPHPSLHLQPLPVPLALLGRDSALRALAAAVAVPGTVITVVGPPGAGKSALAVAALSMRSRPGYAVRLSTDTDTARSWNGAAELSGATVLLDGADAAPAAAARLLDTLDTLRAAQPAAERLSVLVTSRAPLGHPGEQVWPVAPLEPEPAQELLRQAWAASGATPPPGTAADGDLAAIAAAVGGLPGLLVAAAGAAWTYGSDAVRSALTAGRGLPGRAQDDCDGWVSTALDTLPSAVQHAFGALCVLASPWPLAAADLALAVEAETAGGAGSRAERLIETLVAAQLVQALGHGLFAVAGPLRAAGLRHLERPPASWDAGAARRRVALALLAAAQRSVPLLRGEVPGPLLARLQALLPQVDAALTPLLGTASLDAPPADAALARDLLLWWWPVWTAAGQRRRAEAWLGHVAALGPVQPAEGAPLLQLLADAAWRSGDPAAADYAAQALALARRGAGQGLDAGALAASLSDLAALRPPQEARALLDEALALHRQVGDDVGQADALHNLGTLALGTLALGTPTQGGPGHGAHAWADAAGHLERSAALRRRLRDTRGLADSLSNLSVVYSAGGQLGAALAAAEEALSLRRAAGDRPGQAAALTNLAVVQARAQRPQDAMAALDDAERLYSALDDAVGLTRARLNHAELLLDSLDSAAGPGEHARVAAALARAASAYHSVHSKWPDVAGSLGRRLAELHVRSSDTQGALNEAEQWRAIAAALASEGSRASALAVTSETVALPPPGSAAPLPLAAAARLLVDLRAAAVPDEQPVGDVTAHDTPEPAPAAASAPGPDTGTEPAAARALLAAAGLTPREREVLGCLSQGWPNKRVARVLGLSEYTVKNHLATVYAKLGVRGRAEAAVLAAQAGLDPPAVT